MAVNIKTKEKTDIKIYECIKEGGHDIKDFHDGKNDCCIICDKVFNKETGKFAGYRNALWQ